LDHALREVRGVGLNQKLEEGMMGGAPQPGRAVNREAIGSPTQVGPPNWASLQEGAATGMDGGSDPFKLPIIARGIGTYPNQTGKELENIAAFGSPN
jgi:hypothetical protein